MTASISELNQIENDINKILNGYVISDEEFTIDAFEKAVKDYFEKLRQRQQLQLNLGLGTTPKEIMDNLRRD